VNKDEYIKSAPGADIGLLLPEITTAALKLQDRALGDWAMKDGF